MQDPQTFNHSGDMPTVKYRSNRTSQRAEQPWRSETNHRHPDHPNRQSVWRARRHGRKSLEPDDVALARRHKIQRGLESRVGHQPA